MSTVSSEATLSIRTLLLCDLVASTRLVERLGDAGAAEVFAKHDRAARDLLARFHGREIDKSDGFLLLFERPIEAVQFALAYRSRLLEISHGLDEPLATRVGIHLGEVVLRENLPEDIALGAKPLEVEGLAKAVAARVMSLADDGRVLLTRNAYDMAQRAAVGSGNDQGLRWIVHGDYRLAGVEEPIEVCEVIDADDPMPAPPASVKKALRVGEESKDPKARDEPLLAVLAFDNLSTDPEMQFFSDGVSEEIIQRLTRGAKLKVIARTSSFQFRGERKADAARELNCSHVLDGSIRRAAQRVRVSAHLEEAATHTTLWSDRYDRSLEDIFAVQDEISDSIAAALDQAFSAAATETVDPEVYDLYLRASPSSYAPEELGHCVELLEKVTERAPDFAPGWAQLAYLRTWWHFYRPFAERPALAKQVEREAAEARRLDPLNMNGMIAELFIVPPYGHFVEGDRILERIQRAPEPSGGRRYLGWYLRTMGRMREGLEATEEAYRLDALNPMTANLVALARMATGQDRKAIPIYEDLVSRVPEMRFPVTSLLRAYAFLEDWDGVDRMIAVVRERGIDESEAELPFILAKRNPTDEKIGAWRKDLEAKVAKTGCIDVSRLVYAAHLGLVDEAYAVAERAHLGPAGNEDDLMGPDGYRTAMLFQAGMPELRNDPRFLRLSARLGLVKFWTTTHKWPDCADEVPYDFRAACDEARKIPVDPLIKQD